MIHTTYEKTYAPPIRSQKKIGTTTFLVNSYYPKTAKESVTEKLERLIQADLQKEAAANFSETG